MSRRKQMDRGTVVTLLAVVVASTAASSVIAQEENNADVLPLPTAEHKNSKQGENVGRFERVPELSNSLQAGLEAHRIAEQQRLNAAARQLGWNNEMRRRSALPPRQAYDGPGAVGVSPSGTLADSVMQAPWLPLSNVDLFGYRYDNPIRQPMGMESIQRSPTTWESRPVYAEDSGANQRVDTSGGGPNESTVHEPRAEGSFAAVRSKALAALKRGDFAAAIEFSGEMNRQAPGSVEPLALSIHAELGSGNYADAAAGLDLLLASSPVEKWHTITKDYKLYYGSPAAFTRQLRKAESAVRDIPHDVEARLVLGYFYAGLGHQTEATVQLEEVERQAEAESLPHRVARKLLRESNLSEERLPPPAVEDNGAAAQNGQPSTRRGRIF
ncbi:MAG: hypothetical protein MPJ50_09670 [Pirellulales bacterium]|nr:hypothetical protein [Pirellulales bacterium]